ncbi:MAG: aminotransferase class I/II-fold pyridoxal phosphate-dependent enzyme [Rikenellaceae bacterium]
MSATKLQSKKSFRPAERIERVSEYYFSKKLREIAQLNAEGQDIISLGIGGPDRPPHESVVERLCDESRVSSNHSYQSYVGIPQMREAMAKWYGERYGVELDPTKEILPLIGSKEGIMHISMAFLNVGDGVLVPNPGYPTYSAVSRLVQAEVYTYELDPERGWMPDFEALERMPLDKIKLMWVNYPNMPTGTNATREVNEKLVDFARRHSIVVVCDNPYSMILNPNPMSILEVEGARECCIELNSLSKSLNMAGWRIGMLSTNATFVEWILRVKSNIDSGMFKPLQLAAVEALSLGDEWYRELNEIYAQRRVVASKIMKRIDCRYDESQVGLFLWGRIPDDERSAEALCDRLLVEARVFITPGFIFGSQGERYVRLSLCTEIDRMEEALARIEACPFWGDK